MRIVSTGIKGRYNNHPASTMLQRQLLATLCEDQPVQRVRADTAALVDRKILLPGGVVAGAKPFHESGWRFVNRMSCRVNNLLADSRRQRCP